MNQSTEELIERLLRGISWQDDGWPVSGVDKTMEEAAQAIADLQAENERFREALQKIEIIDVSYSNTKIARAALKGYQETKGK